MSPSPRPSFRVLLVLLSLVAVLGGACSSAGASPSVALASPTPSPTAAPTARPSRPPAPPPAPAFPVTLTDDEGTAVKLAAEPQKIVSLTPAATETLFARRRRRPGRRDRRRQRLPGRGRRAARRRHVRVGRRREGRRASTPTSSSPAASASPRPTRSPSSARSASRSSSSMRRRSTGSTRTSSWSATRPGSRRRPMPSRPACATDIDARRDGRIGRGRRAGTKPRVFYDVGYLPDTGQIYGAGDGLVPRRDGVQARGRRHHGRSDHLRDPAGEAHRARPAGDHPGRQRLLHADGRRRSPSATGWSVLTAVKNGDIRPVNDTEITRPGPRLPTGLRNLALAMYPDITLPPAP